LPNLVLAAVKIVRMDRAVRPCFPMTLPKSSGATRNSMIVVFSLLHGDRIRFVHQCLSHGFDQCLELVHCRTSREDADTKIPSGLRFDLHLLQQTCLMEQVMDRQGWRGSPPQPLNQALLLEHHGGWILKGIIGAEDLDVPAVSRHPGIGGHYSIEGPFSPAPAR
jgi:hypothetical protein